MSENGRRDPPRANSRLAAFVALGVGFCTTTAGSMYIHVRIDTHVLNPCVL